MAQQLTAVEIYKCRYDGDVMWALVKAGWSIGSKITTTKGDVWALMVRS